jgi:hypothetical protein
LNSILTTRNQFSYVRLGKFTRLDLPVDIHGQPAGAQYEPFLTHKTMRSIRSLRVPPHGIWSGRIHQFGSLEEFEVFLALEANPHIIDIREQYPVVSSRVLGDVLDGKTVARNRILTFDFVLTLPPHPGGTALRYHVGSSKPEHSICKPREIARRGREQEQAAAWGWSWSYLKRPPTQVVVNLRKLRGWAKYGSLDAAAAEAADLAHLFKKTTSTKSLRKLLEQFGRRLGIPPERQYHCYGAAFYLGYLPLDTREVVDEDMPPCLLEPGHEQ